MAYGKFSPAHTGATKRKELLMIYITAIHMSPPSANHHQHIASLKWVEPGEADDDGVQP